MPAGRPPVDIETKLNELDQVLPEGEEKFVDKVARSTVDELNKLLAEIAKAEAYNQQAKSMDMGLAQAKEAYEAAGQDYKDATKANKLRTQFVLRVLKDKGGM